MKKTTAFTTISTYSSEMLSMKGQYIFLGNFSTILCVKIKTHFMFRFKAYYESKSGQEVTLQRKGAYLSIEPSWVIEEFGKLTHYQVWSLSMIF